MNKRSARQNAASSGYRASYNYDNQPGFPGYGGGAGYGAGPGYGIETPPAFIQEPWAVTQWTEYYIPTVNAGGRRPVIYVAAPLPAGNPFGGLGGGFGGGLGGGMPFL